MTVLQLKDSTKLPLSGGTVTGSITVQGTPGLNVSVSAGTWSYIRLNNGSNYWDIATNSGQNSGALDFRPGGAANKGPRINTAGMTSFANVDSATGNGMYGNAAIQIRETNYGGAGSDTWGVAPRLAWHWSGRVANMIGLASSGWLYAGAGPTSGGASMSRIVLENGGDYNIHASRDLALTGGTLSGDIRVSKSGPMLNLRDTAVDLSKTNNNLSSGTHYPGVNIEDNAGRIVTRLEAVISSNGSNGFNLYARNYNTSGTQTGQKGITGYINKSGTMTYSVSDAANFRSAISALSTSGGTLTGRLYSTSDAISVGYMDIDSGDNNTAALRLRTAKSMGGSVENAIVFHRTWTETTYTIQIASDRRLKNHIDYLDKHDSVSFIKSLNPVLYSLKSDKNNDKHLGFYAQDVQESDIWGTSIVRESENTNDGKDGPDSVFSLDYTQLHAPIVAALQAALERIDQLEARVAELEAKGVS